MPSSWASLSSSAAVMGQIVAGAFSGDAAALLGREHQARVRTPKSQG
jgi:hypothetical protein